MIRLLHTADWQIGKPFGGFEPELSGVLRAERVAAVGRIALLAEERRCDAVLVAGDVFDDNFVPNRDVNRTIDAMRGFSGPWVLLPGNHDAALSVSVWTQFRRLADQVGLRTAVIADKPEILTLCDGRLAMLPAPLTRRHEAADVTEWFDDARTPPKAIRVGLAHGSLANRLPEAAEAHNVIAEDRALLARLDYLALGDWHGFVEIAPKTVYAGTPEPDRYPANAPGHVAIVEIDAPGAAPRIEKVRVARFDWRRLSLRLDGDITALEEALSVLPAPGDTLIHLTLSGSLPLRDRVALEASLSAWRDRLFHLEIEDADLFDEPDEDDLDAIDLSGFVRTAVERLRAKAQDAADPERAAAARALRMIYVEHRRLAGAAER
ncbi:metallophosphoesterase family protein [Jiella marina]|uniref:metallophosphoesterase family protein n=1 Tax=Jiella sp. LLJ827 TaxID=2917712 RepID=UPI00210118B4|nr:DNA repair exonuclease [Jiella sp. LLJ827]MCQ0988972.1 DNA repair exonuclease [Jiella sp. LLJ827]